MNDLKEAFKSKDFLINSNIVKNISELDISLDEFLLILYFINVSVELNLEDIKQKLGFSDEKTYETFNNLINKKYIEIKVTKTNNKVVETIVLDTFYDRLILNKKEEIKETDIYAIFEKELGRTLSSFEYEIVNRWLEKGTSEETIKEALKEAILSGVTNFKYIDKIIYEWNKKGIKKRIEKEETSIEEMFDYNWLGEEE